MTEVVHLSGLYRDAEEIKDFYNCMVFSSSETTPLDTDEVIANEIIRKPVTAERVDNAIVWTGTVTPGEVDAVVRVVAMIHEVEGDPEYIRGAHTIADTTLNAQNGITYRFPFALERGD